MDCHYFLQVSGETSKYFMVVAIDEKCQMIQIKSCHYTTIPPRVVESFHSKLQISTSWWCKTRSQRIKKVTEMQLLEVSQRF